MLRSVIAMARLELDACAAHGTWLDRGELERASSAFAEARQSRAKVESLMRAAPTGVAGAYRRGVGGMARAAASSLRDVARAGVDSAIEGREEDREDMLLKAVETAVDILLDKDE
jgi:hypothetical protein